MPPELVDQYERPLRKELLTREIAGPTVTGIRSMLGTHPEQGLTPPRLASILAAAEQGDAAGYLDLAEAMEEKEPRYLAVLGTRKRQVSQLEITVEPASDSAEDEANAELVRSFLEREELEDEIFDILDSIGKGYSVTEIVWETSERDWMPKALKWRMPRWFELDRLDGETLYLRREPGSDSALPSLARGPMPYGPPGDGALLPPYKFITHRTQAKSGLPIRGGLARAVGWWYLFKNYAIKDWVTFVEVYGQPLRVGKFHPGASPEDKRILLRALASIGTDAAAMIPEGMMIEFVRSEGAQANAKVYADLVDYIDNLITLLVLGQNLTTQVQEGSRAAATVHNDVRADIERADSRQLAASLNRDLIRPIVDLNRGAQKAYPKIKIGRPEQADVAVLSEALSKLVPLGLKVGQAEVRRKIGVADPDDESDLLTAPAPALGPADPTFPDPSSPPMARPGGAAGDQDAEDEDADPATPDDGDAAPDGGDSAMGLDARSARRRAAASSAPSSSARPSLPTAALVALRSNRPIPTDRPDHPSSPPSGLPSLFLSERPSSSPSSGMIPPSSPSRSHPSSASPPSSPSGLVRGPSPQATAARRPTRVSADQLQIEDEAERLAGDWERVLGRRVRDILDLAEASNDLAGFRARLAELASADPDPELATTLERIGFNARLWGYWRAREGET